MENRNSTSIGLKTKQQQASSQGTVSNLMYLKSIKYHQYSDKPTVNSESQTVNLYSQSMQCAKHNQLN
jgi:hypothetical protein